MIISRWAFAFYRTWGGGCRILLSVAEHLGSSSFISALYYYNKSVICFSVRNRFWQACVVKVLLLRQLTLFLRVNRYITDKQICNLRSTWNSNSIFCLGATQADLIFPGKSGVFTQQVLSGINDACYSS